jgi:YidC/Oxa1 family membrane protein insertase
MQTRNVVLFIVFSAVIIVGWMWFHGWFSPANTPPSTGKPDDTAEKKPDDSEGPKEKPPPAALLAAGTAGLGAGPDGNPWLALPGLEIALPRPKARRSPPTPDDRLLWLGAREDNSPFHLHVAIDPRGAGVRRVTLNKFKGAGPDGRPLPPVAGATPPLELIPDDPYSPSYLLYLYDPNDPYDDHHDRPMETLGVRTWTGPDGKEPAFEETTLDDGRKQQTVTLVAPVAPWGVRVTKKYTLTEREYHVGLEVRLALEPTGEKKPGDFKVRYQMTGPRNLPVEGRWYTSIFRNCLVGMVDKSKSVDRVLQDLRQVSNWEGGAPVPGEKFPRREGYWIRYAGVAVQYFASVAVVDDQQPEQTEQNFISHVRPTLEVGVTKGLIESVAEDKSSFVLKRANTNDEEPKQTFRVPSEDEWGRAKQGRDEFLGRLRENTRVAVIHTTDPDGPVALALRDEGQTQPLWENDVTVRLVTEALPLAAGKDVVHKYLLYNGPVKVMLLKQPDGAAQEVQPGLVDRYINDLRLDSLTDAPSNTWYGWLASALFINPLLFAITNGMHWLLYWIHFVVPNYILCIVVLTVLVRGTMFPISRKGAQTSIRMQALAPELKKLAEKYKEDKQALAAAQMELYRKNGVNPFGTCWLLLLQMPIFMGLYYCLQESVHFRLTALSDWWIPNLAAPDMLLYWTEYIPFISTPDWFGWFWYLGPFLNVLPIIAVSLMMVQQKLTMPPPTDEQQEMQQKMMKWMVAVMGVMFYKVAAGLCIYFIASNLWSFAERRLLPKKKPGDAAPDAKPKEGYFTKILGAAKAAQATAGSTAMTTAPSSAAPPTGVTSAPRPDGKKKGRKKRRQDRARGAEPPRGPASSPAAAPPKADGSMWQRLRAWWQEVLEEARKKGQHK